MKANWFRKLSLLIEKYYLETFIIEFLIIVALYPSLRVIERVAIAAVITLVAAEGLKVLVREKRPAPARERALYKKTFPLDLRSFPSAHAAIAMAFAGALLNSTVFWPVFAIGLLISYGRLYIKSHYPHDVIVGGMIGFLIGYGVLLFF